MIPNECSAKIQPTDYLLENFGVGAVYKFMPNGGNLGDNLICAATLQQFSAASLRWEFIEGGAENIGPHDVLVYGGGGALVDLYDGAFESLDFLMSLNRPIVVLPHTVRGRPDFWERCNDITVMCRDMESYKYLSQFENVKRLLADDMAINLDLTCSPFKEIVELRSRLEGSNLLREKAQIFRRDQETRFNVADDDTIDLSDIAHPDMRNVAQVNALAVFFLTALAGFKEVHSDRLHVAIGAAILGVKVGFFDNIYGKNRNVYDFSLERRFKNVKFCSDNYNLSSLKEIE